MQGPDARTETDPATTEHLTPAAAPDRLPAVDTLRGVAVLGILPMNIYAFAMPFAAYANPLVYGGDTGLDLATWLVNHLLVDQKFMTLFSMLFGAGLVLMQQRADARGVPSRGLYYRRQLWLLLIGAVHAYLLWLGDILFHYALCGMLIYPLRRKSPKTLIVVGSLAVLVALPISTGMGLLFEEVRREALAAEEKVAAGEELSAEEEETRAFWNDMKDFMEPTDEEMTRQVKVHQGSYLDIAAERIPSVFMMHVFMTLTFIVWRVGGLMLIGMALMKLGVFSAARSSRFYRWCVAAGYGVGLPLVAVSAHQLMVHEFDAFYVFRVGGAFNYLGSIAVAFGHLGLVMLACRSGVFAGLRAWLAAVGRMALTNYLAQTLILTTVFYGYGFGLFGQVSRFEQVGFVLGVWILQVGYSPLWLRHFRFGPFEWAWRSLTYGRLQPMSRA
jgi:uncharacterized protein